MRYRLRALKASKDITAEQATVTAAEGKPTVLTGELNLTLVPAGDYTLTLEVRNAKNQVLSTQTTTVRRDPANYAPAGAVLPR